jgi:general secretion pathway protein D
VKRRARGWLFALALLAGSPAFTAGTDDRVTLNFANADLETVIRAVGELTGRNFIIDPRVKGTVNILSAQPVSRALAYQILLSSLRLQGFSAIEGRGVVKIVPEQDAKLHARSGVPGKNDGDRLITQVFMLKNSNATQLLPVIRPIVSPNNALSAFAQANALVVTDYADNLQRIAAIIARVEGAADSQTAVIPLLYASAPELAATLGRLLQESAGETGRTTVLADARANVLLVRADLPGRLGQVRALVRALDQPSQAGANVRVVYLRNADATRVAQTLRALLSSSASPLADARRGGNLPSSSDASGIAQTGLSGGQTDGAPSGQPPPAPPPGDAASDTAAAGNAGNAGNLVQADNASNALILNVPDGMYRNLRGVIDQLDRRRAQVHVETLVMEVSAQRMQELGVQWFTQPVTPGGQGPTAQVLIGAGQGGLSVGTGRGVFSIRGIGQIADLTALARALETEAQGNILSNPTLLATDNEQARIEVGQEISIQTGQYANTGSSGSSSTASPFTTYERKTVGLKLVIVPQISEGGTLRMKILQTASSVDPTTGTTTLPTVNVRAVETSVTVASGGIIAIGGLIQETVSDTEDKVPLLGDIPLLGWLFKHSVRKRNKTNLLVFLKPTIVRDEEGARAIAEDRYRYVIGNALEDAERPMPLGLPAVVDGLPRGLLPVPGQAARP